MGIEPLSIGENKEIIATSFLSSFYLLFSSPLNALAGAKTNVSQSNELPTLRSNIARRVLARKN